VQGCDVVVAGGGIGGMTAALLLGSAGASVTLLERVAEPAAVGAGILLQPNGLAVLYALGLGKELQRAAWRTPPAAIRDPTGSVLLELTLPDFGGGLDHALVLRRSHLYWVLLAAVHAHPAVAVRLGTQVTWASPGGTVRSCRQGVEAESTADLVVGADGAASTVRAHGDFGAVTHATGARYVRALVPGVGNELGWGEYWTPLGLFGEAPLGDGSTYLYLGCDFPTGRQGPGRAGPGRVPAAVGGGAAAGRGCAGGAWQRGCAADQRGRPGRLRTVGGRPAGAGG
jgi:2-polyprenyl-6-methoxyphenol hydroxylase-like FAD-dependent oxidoreductase